MNRKDIIIVAVVINMLLLVTLFISALKPDKTSTIAATDLTKNDEKEIITTSKKNASEKSIDQIDQVLSQYSAKTSFKNQDEKKIVPSLSKTNIVSNETNKISNTLSVDEDCIVTVEKGDVLEKIAKSNNVSVNEIMKTNSLSNTRLQIGQKITLPKKHKTEKSLAVTKPKSKSYTVKTGDSPWSIAQENNMLLEDLLHINGIDEEQAKRIRPGDLLKIK